MHCHFKHLHLVVLHFNKQRKLFCLFLSPLGEANYKILRKSQKKWIHYWRLVPTRALIQWNPQAQNFSFRVLHPRLLQFCSAIDLQTCSNIHLFDIFKSTWLSKYLKVVWRLMTTNDNDEVNDKFTPCYS